MTYEEFKKEWLSESEEVICHTSGSTGTPTLIHLPKKEMKRSAMRTCSFFGIDASSHLHSCIAPDYIGGKMMLIRSMETGASFSFEKPSNRPFENYNGKRIDLVSVVPSQMIHVLENYTAVPEIDTFLIGGAPLSPEIRDGIIEKKIKAYESYGMTETASHIALRKVDSETLYFTTLPGVAIFYHKDNLLGIKIDGWKTFLTNDIADIINGHEFRILGRHDNIIITGGKKVSPESLESILSPFLKFPFFISSKKDKKWGERIVLVVSDANLSDSNIINVCRSNLKPFEVPKEIIRLSQLPLTLNGKIKRIKF